VIYVSGDNSTIVNETEYIIVLADGANGNSVTSLGPVTDNGSNNSVTIQAGGIEVPDVVAHWSLGESSGTIASDVSGNGHHGTIENATWVDIDGRRALDFNGTSSSVSLPATAFGQVSDQVSVAIWAFGDPDQLPKESSVFYAHNGDSRVLNVHLPWSDSKIYWDAPDRISRTATEEEFEGGWVHWVFTKDANSGVMNIYRNGQLWHTGSDGTTMIGAITGCRIGSQLGQRFYDGMIEEVQLYDLALNSFQVENLYSSSSSTTVIGDAQVTTAKSDTAPAMSDTDLAQTHYLSSFLAGGGDTDEHASLFNGIVGNDDGDADDIGEVRLNPTSTVTITFDTSVYAGGFDLTGITTCFGWNTTGGGRSNQGYEILVSFVDGTSESLAGPEHWEPNEDPAEFWTTVSFTPMDSEYLARGVKSVSFDITNGGNAGPTLVAREFDIFGTPTFTALEEWRFVNFGTYGNFGNAGDDYDADFDGVSNLLEYATGLNPNDASDSRILELKHSLSSPGELEISFDTIDDSSLRYTLQESDTLLPDDWDPIWSGTGSGDETIVIPQSAWPDLNACFFRLEVSD
jgi:hypothetical protein